MKIQRIEVKNLFGIFNHVIPLNSTEQITIIHGPNGFGKTILLNMVYHFFNTNFYELLNIPFSEFCLEFDDGKSIVIKKERYQVLPILPDENKKNPIESSLFLLFEYKENEKETPQQFQYRPLTVDDIDFSMSAIERRIPELTRVGPTNWIYDINGERYSLDRVISQFGEQLGISKPRTLKFPPWLTTLIKNKNVYLIKTQRLISFSGYDRKLRERRYGYEVDSRSPTPVVIKYSNEITQKIGEILAGNSKLSQSLDRSFPIRVVKLPKNQYLTIKEAQTNLLALEEKRKKLSDAALLNKEEINLKELLEFDKTDIKMLTVYIGDVKVKLAEFDNIYSKISILVNIINNHFQYKKFSISQENGFVFTASNGNIIPLQFLSSGEQHELVLFYELLFKVEPDSLILIDEPELSLHVCWQEQFLTDLKNITQLIGLDAIIATHSPEIINDRWDLTVELKGPK
jgi:predicted ATP-binding protein involved in virulence